MDKEREKLIGARFRAFRETLQIPRAPFAVRIGYGSERIASYEAGRAPLPYEVFRSTAKHYQISALWLAGDGGGPKIKNFIDDAIFIGEIPPRALFSTVYDSYLKEPLKLKIESVNQLGKTLIANTVSFDQVFDDESLPLEFRKKLARKFIKTASHTLNKAKKEAARRRDANAKLQAIIEKQGLTSEAYSLTTASVNPVLPKLIQRLKHATEARGSKSELAAWLGVHRQSVTDWLSGKQEPGGEITLQLLHWVEQRERQK